jgi:hypothetical protein
MRAARVIAFIAVLTVSLAGSATAATPSLRFSSFPTRALPGGSATVTVAITRAQDVCTLRVSYAKGAAQAGLSPRTTTGRRVTWTWKLAANTHAGQAKATVVCKSSGKISRSMMVVGAVLPPKIDVVKQGFSIKTPRYGGDSVSYGVMLANHSKTSDALEVTVLVNFVNAKNEVIASDSTAIPVIRAQGNYALGKSVTFPGRGPVARLEIAVRVVGKQPSVRGPLPSLANMRILANPTDPAWLGSIEGEISNQAPKLVLSSAAISVVVFDAAGNVLGGGTGSAYASIPSGARHFIKLTTGLESIEAEKAATAQYSISPLYTEQRP